MKIKKYEKLICSLCINENCVLHKETLKQALNDGLVLQKVHQII